MNESSVMLCAEEFEATFKKLSQEHELDTIIIGIGHVIVCRSLVQSNPQAALLSFTNAVCNLQERYLENEKG